MLVTERRVQEPSSSNRSCTVEPDTGAARCGRTDSRLDAPEGRLTADHLPCPAMRHRPLALIATLALALGILASCGSSGGDASSTTAAGKATTTATTKPLDILVSNDDGYSAPGIDALVEGLRARPDVKITVAAPLTQQSGTGGKETEGKLKVTDVRTKSGFPAKAVDGYPSDAIRVAMDELGVKPDVVITGINEGQNLSPLMDASGTVGAARAAVARGVPALATSQGAGDTFDYAAAVPLIVAWLQDHRADLLAGTMKAEVTNLNIPSCDTGKIRGLVEAEVDTSGDGVAALQRQDCTSTAKPADPSTDVAAFSIGYATIGVIPAKPAA